MKIVITYGTYDLLHQGHLNLLKRAKELGDYLIVGVTNDNFDRDRGKLNVRNNVLERVEAVKATGYADKIIIEDYVGQKIDDIKKLSKDKYRANLTVYISGRNEKIKTDIRIKKEDDKRKIDYINLKDLQKILESANLKKK